MGGAARTSQPASPPPPPPVTSPLVALLPCPFHLTGVKQAEPYAPGRPPVPGSDRATHPPQVVPTGSDALRGESRAEAPGGPKARPATLVLLPPLAKKRPLDERPPLQEQQQKEEESVGEPDGFFSCAVRLSCRLHPGRGFLAAGRGAHSSDQEEEEEER